MSHLKLKDEEQAMRATYDGNDVFILLPAGFGKSIVAMVKVSAFRLFLSSTLVVRRVPLSWCLHSLFYRSEV